MANDMIDYKYSTIWDYSNRGAGRLDVVCFGGEDWWYHNRGHIDMQLMRRYGRLGTTVYINSVIMQKPSLKKGIGGGANFSQKLIRKAASIARGLRKSDAGFWVYSPFIMPVHHVNGLKRLNEKLLMVQVKAVIRKLGMDRPLVWVACPPACNVAVKLQGSGLVYQRTDRFEEYPNVDAQTIARYDCTLKAAADLTIFVNEKLRDEEADQCRKSIYLDHGVDFDLFAEAHEDPTVPDGLRDIPRPIVGFFGGIDGHTSDTVLIRRIVDMLDDMSFVFVGKASVDCESLAAKRNVHMLGQRDYKLVPHYGKCFDVCIMPWRRNKWIETCNPVKLKEYLALGKPVVSTPFPELERYLDVVYRADKAEDFVDCIRRAVVEDGPESAEARRNRVKDSSWDSKAQLVLNELFQEDAAGGRAETPAADTNSGRSELASSFVDSKTS